MILSAWGARGSPSLVVTAGALQVFLLVLSSFCLVMFFVAWCTRRLPSLAVTAGVIQAFHLSLSCLVMLSGVVSAMFVFVLTRMLD